MSECVPEKDERPSIFVMAKSFLFTINRVRHFQYGQQLGYAGRREYADIPRVRTFVLRGVVSAWIFEEVESVPLNFRSIFFGHMLIGYTLF